MSFGRLLYLFAIAVAVVWPVRTWVGEPIVVASASMEPTLRVGKLMILDKVTLRRRAPRRGDVLSFPSPDDPKMDLIKRVIALPGETVELREKKVYINGERLIEIYTEHTRAGERLQGDDLGPLTVPPGAVFVLGDNRDESRDSATWKEPFVRLERVQGIVRRLPWA